MFLKNEDIATLVNVVAALRSNNLTELAVQTQDIVDRAKESKQKRSDYVNKQQKILRGTYQGD